MIYSVVVQSVNRFNKFRAATFRLSTLHRNAALKPADAAAHPAMFYSSAVIDKMLVSSKLGWLVLAALLASVTASGQSGVITTVAGNGTAGYSGDGGPATSAALRLPNGVAVDSSGNLYIADTSNSRIRKVTASTGVITTVAGNGTGGYSGDGGSATSAELFAPSGVAVDNSGNLYIADFVNMDIRKVSASGIITTVAGGGCAASVTPNCGAGDGGPATSAELTGPMGVAVDSSGNLYIADFGNSRIRKVTAGTGIITTVAGSAFVGSHGDGGPATSAELFLPSGVAVDSSDNLYIADTSNCRIRKVTASTGVITTVAGNGSEIYSGDGGPATSAALFLPTGVAVDSDGNLYIADTHNQRIRKVTGSAGGAVGRPAISANGVVNGADFLPSIVANSWVTIQGTNLASQTGDWSNSIVNGKLPTTLNGVSVSIGGEPAYIYYTSPGQINVLAPDVAPGPAAVTVATAGGTSAAVTVTANLYGPAFFLWPGNQPVATRPDFTFVAKAGTFPGATTVPATPGETIILWATGFGPTTPVAPTGVAVPGDQTYATASAPTVTIDNIPTKVLGAALAPGSAGLYQIAIQVPASLADGDWPIQATIGGVQSPPSVVLTTHQ
jgi:uncharacterized protein (TIGR03437 family)